MYYALMSGEDWIRHKVLRAYRDSGSNKKAAKIVIWFSNSPI